MDRTINSIDSILQGRDRSNAQIKKGGISAEHKVETEHGWKEIFGDRICERFRLLIINHVGRDTTMEITRCTQSWLRSSGARATMREIRIIYQLLGPAFVIIRRDRVPVVSPFGEVKTYVATKQAAEMTLTQTKTKQTMSGCRRNDLDGRTVVRP